MSADAKANNPAENYQFRIHPSIIYSLITAQASGVEKALLELVMNSVDAGATRIDVMLNEKEFKVEDNGHGFKDLEAIEQCFGILGLPHQEGDAYYGRFRLGRMQTFGYAKTIWHTKNYKMLVDLNVSPEIESYGYEIIETADFHQGCMITGEFYECMLECDPNVDLAVEYLISPYDVSNAVAALAISVKYLPVDIYINGFRANRRQEEIIPYTSNKHALFFLNPQKNFSSGVMNKINVFNKGVFAYAIDSAVFTGDIVSLSAIDLNMARNEPKATCGVNRSIRGKMSDLASEIYSKQVVVKTSQTEINQEAFVANFWSKLLRVNGSNFDDLCEFLAIYSRDWFQTPENLTVGFSSIWSHLSNGYIDQYNQNGLRPRRNALLTFYSRDYLVEHGAIPSEMDQISLNYGYVPFDLLPDSDFMQHLPEELTFSSDNFSELADCSERVFIDGISEKIPPSLTLNERYQTLLRFLLKIHLGISAIQEYGLEMQNDRLGRSRFGRTDFHCHYFYLKKFDRALTVDDCKNITEKYSMVLHRYIQVALNNSMQAIADSITFKSVPKELGYQFCQLIKGRCEFENSLKLSPFQQSVLDELKSFVENGLSTWRRTELEDSLGGELLSEGYMHTVTKRKLFLADLNGCIGLTDAFDYVLVDQAYFLHCIEKNKYLDLFFLIAHEMAHTSAALSMVHGEVFHIGFQKNISDFNMWVGNMEETISEKLFNKKNFRSKMAFENYGASQENAEFFMRKGLMKLEGRY